MIETETLQRAIHYTHETITLDGMSFADCEFRKCRLVYNGGEAPHFDGCKFDHCDWRFEGPAARTLEHMKVVWAAGAKPVVQGLIKEITGAGGR
jgi:hypothetical protein